MEAQSVAARLKNSGLFRMQGLIGGKWIDAYDGKTVKVCHICFVWKLPYRFLLMPTCILLLLLPIYTKCVNIKHAPESGF